jgi:hypothetical protein
MQTPQELSMTVTTPIATRFDAQAAAGQVTAVKPATVETNSIEEGDGCNGRLGAGLTERNLTSRWVGPAHAEPVVQGTAGCHAGGNLPAEIASFVGRRRELADAKRALSKSRLVTLTGVGGVGKTRVAERVARDRRRAYPHGVWLAICAWLPI